MDVDNSYEFHLSNVKKLPAGLSVFLGHERVRLCGFNIKGNLQTFKKDFPIINIKNMVDRCIDLAAMYNKVCRSSERWSMLERLVHQTLKMKFEKTKTVRTSKWHEVPLTYNQMKYAATEVYVRLLLFSFLINVPASLFFNLTLRRLHEKSMITSNQKRISTNILMLNSNELFDQGSR